MAHTKPIDSRIEQLIMGDLRSCWIVRGTKTLLIDTGFPSDHGDLLSGLASLDLAPDNIDYLALTHLHFDHAGGAGHLARLNPDLKVLIHVRGVRHLVAPTRLTASVKRAYGDRFAMIGEPVPIVDHQVNAITTGDIIDLGDSQIEVFNSPGHARHHVVFYDQTSQSVFSGDAMGSRYPGYPNFVLTPPDDYDHAVSKTTIDLIRALKPKRIHYTHCGSYPVAADDGIYETLKAEHDQWNRVIREIIALYPQLSHEEIFSRFLEQLVHLQDYPDQHISFALSVKGITGALRRPETTKN